MARPSASVHRWRLTKESKTDEEKKMEIRERKALE